MEKPFHAQDEGTARKTVYPADILTFHKEWDVLIKDNVPKVLVTEQPLKHLIPEEIWKEFITAAQNPFLLKSIKDCHYYRESSLKRHI